jgi:ribA/ribD-fused uncharacterized protein
VSDKETWPDSLVERITKDRNDAQARVKALEQSYRHSYCESRTAHGCAVCGFELSDPLHMAASVPETKQFTPIGKGTICSNCTKTIGYHYQTAEGLLLCEVPRRTGEMMNEHHKLDTDSQVFFYEQDFYVLSNFSAFHVVYEGRNFVTSEEAYHYQKFPHAPDIQREIVYARSAHDAFKIAERHREYRRADWDQVKVDIMRDILLAKANQHEYVRRKLLATGDRELIEDSWRDAFWGWGESRDGRNMLGKLWMEVRSALRQVERV